MTISLTSLQISSLSFLIINSTTSKIHTKYFFRAQQGTKSLTSELYIFFNFALNQDLSKFHYVSGQIEQCHDPICLKINIKRN